MTAVTSFDNVDVIVCVNSLFDWIAAYKFNGHNPRVGVEDKCRGHPYQRNGL